jgi:hypothetical protein
VSRAIVALAVANVAVTLLACVIDTVQVERVPAHTPPLQPVKVAPKLGAAVIVTLALAAWLAAQPEPPEELQSSPAPLMRPFPITCALSRYVVFPPAKVAWTFAAPVIVSVHVVDVKAEQEPPHEVKAPLEPDAGIAVSVRDVLAGMFAVQPGPSAVVQ